MSHPVVAPEWNPIERAAAVAEALADIVPTPAITARARILRELADSAVSGDQKSEDTP